MYFLSICFLLNGQMDYNKVVPGRCDAGVASTSLGCCFTYPMCLNAELTWILCLILPYICTSIERCFNVIFLITEVLRQQRCSSTELGRAVFLTCYQL